MIATANKIWKHRPGCDSVMLCCAYPQHVNREENKNFYSIFKLDIGDISVCRVDAIHVHGREGLSSMHYSPLALKLPSLGVKPLLFKRSCGAFRLMWSEGIVWCMRENVEGKVDCVCEWVCVCAPPCVWHGRGTSVKGLPGQTFGCPWQCTPGGAGLVKGPLRVLHSPGQKLGPSW